MPTAHTLLSEELFATYFATSLLCGVFGATFTSRDSVSESTRIGVNVAFLSLAILILIWAVLSHLNMIAYRFHRALLFLIVAITLAGFIYCIYDSGSRAL